MPCNIEIKSKLPNGMDEAEKVAKSLAETGEVHECLHQVDTFFPNGDDCRMKLRQENGGSFMITYHRSDVAGPKESKFTRFPVPDGEEWLNSLSAAIGVKGKVEKDRKVYLIKWTKEPYLTARVHLDTVKGLGEFLEFEVMLVTETEEEIKLGTQFAEELMESFGIRQEDLVKGAYLDHLLNN